MLFAPLAAAVAGSVLLLPSAVLAYTFKFSSVPTQCGDFNLTIDGSDGKAPYTALIIPFGTSPISNEVRRVMSIPFNDSSSLSFKLRYPENSQFVLVVR
jgi:hypothetical protein